MHNGLHMEDKMFIGRNPLILPKHDREQTVNKVT